MLEKITARSVIVFFLVSASFAVAILDKNFRPTFGDLAKVGVGGYLGQLIPESKN